MEGTKKQELSLDRERAIEEYDEKAKKECEPIVKKIIEDTLMRMIEKAHQEDRRKKVLKIQAIVSKTEKKYALLTIPADVKMYDYPEGASEYEINRIWNYVRSMAENKYGFNSSKSESLFDNCTAYEFTMELYEV